MGRRDSSGEGMHRFLSGCFGVRESALLVSAMATTETVATAAAKYGLSAKAPFMFDNL